MPKWHALVDVYTREMFEFEDIEAETRDEAHEVALERASRLGAEEGDVTELALMEEMEEMEENEPN